MIYPAFASENSAVEIFSILLAIALATGFSTLSEYRNSKRSSALQEEYSKTFAKVIRNGKVINLLTSEIVKDDIVLVQAGDKVPVDGIIVKGSIKVSQAALNGESRNEFKVETDSLDEAESTDYSSKNKVFMGSVVTSGEAYMIATVIGDASELGKINAALNEGEDEERKDATTLKLEVLVGQIGKLGTICAVIAGILQVIFGIIRATEAITVVTVLSLIAEGIMLGAAILIMAIPEGLALIVSLIQSMNSESMYKKNILVSHKAAFADSAFMNILFSDKTGTITGGKLELVEFIQGDAKIVPKAVNDEVTKALTINNLAKVDDTGKAIGSNNMDRALLTYALNNGYKNTDYSSEIKEESGFDSEKKCATVLLNNGETYWKGATESIINEITHYIDSEGNEKAFKASDKEAVLSKMDEQAKRSMKMLSVAKFSADGKKKVLYSILCLRDNVRPDAVETVNTLNSAGIQVVMVTGDAEDTAVAIAKDAKILNSDTDIVLTHDKLEKLSDEELKKELPNLKVVSRAKPLDKQRLVKVAQQLDNVVGMTGDGINDAPALQQADIGFSMGDGTAVAQEAGDVIILNNSLTSIKDAVLNSRTMMKSIGKFLVFQLSINLSTILMNVLSPIVGISEPFSIVSILYINLIMDTIAALMYGGEPVLERYMNEKPVKRDASILTSYIKSAIGVSSVYITLGSLLILKDIGEFTTMLTPPGCTDKETYAKTVMFAFFIYSILFNSLNTRSEKMNLFEHIKENKNFIYILCALFIIQTIIIEIGGSVFGITRLDAKSLLAAFILGFIIIPVDMIRKLIINK
jgi:calcium-translocating P-type ATPase